MVVKTADETQPLMKAQERGMPKAPPWATAVSSARDEARYLPQAIAHRGYKVAWPENSMGAFKGAVAVGAHAIETDVHLSSDGVVVLSHDPSLKRCFGVDKKISECSWDYLSTLTTLREPKQGLPRFGDLLEYLAEPGLEKIWVMLDIKVDDAADDLIGALAKTIAAAPVSEPWDQRIMLGCWNATFLEACRATLPSFSIALITFSLAYARHFLPVPNVGISMFQKMLLGPLGARFLRDCRRAESPVYVWTVNDERQMEWCIRKNLARGHGEGKAGSGGGQALLDGVITDDPKLFLEVCRRWEDELDGKVQRRRRGMVSDVTQGTLLALQYLALQVMGTVLYIVWRFVRPRLDLLKDRKKLGAV